MNTSHLNNSTNSAAGDNTGTGVIAGGAVRAVVEMAGIRDIRTKCLRSNNPQNVVAATMDGLKALRDAQQVAAVRGIDAAKLK